VVPGEHAKATRVGLQTLGDAVLCRKVRVSGVLQFPVRLPVVPGVLLAHVAAEGLVHAGELCHKAIVTGGLRQALLTNAPEHLYGVVERQFPQIPIQPAEKVRRVEVPRPPEVVSQFA